ncbi:hypothetical protein JMJ35_008063 [Cladonia borealis]|uniref:receptor protein-tyrosine kinase n=1 Tax=Cladonia borealis TaxID=184061 RepID=A0AA39V3A6_9LECA|nr:hypothetical protein JMJ35_008063 [Cladonia borealis]
MQRQIILLLGIALANAAKVAGQAAATTTSNPLNNFIGAAGAAASKIKSAEAAETASSSSSSTTPSPTSTPPPPAATTSHSAAAAAHSGLSEAAKIGIIVGCVVGALLILAILAGICCCLVRRRRRNRRRTVDTNEKETSPKPWKSPINPGRHYSNYTPAQRGEVTTDTHHPTVPLMAAAATDHHMHSEKAPSLSQHPAMRPQPENPFVPVPPSPRRTEPNQHGSGVRDGLIAGTAAGAGAYAMHEHHKRQPKSQNGPYTYNNNNPNHHDSGARDGLLAGAGAGAGAYAMHEHNNRHSKASTMLPAYSNNNNNNNANHHDHAARDGLIAGTAAGAGAYAMHEHNNHRHSPSLPTHNNNNPDRPPTPFGLAGFGTTTQPNTTNHQPRANSPPYASVGQPYNDMHVHVLQTDPPSHDLRHSLQKHEEPLLPPTTYADAHHPTYRNSKGYSTPPEVPSRSPNRRSNIFADSSYDSSLTTTTTSSNDSGYARYTDPYAPRQRESIQPYLQQHMPQQAFMSGGNNEGAPPMPSYREQRRTSHSPRGSRSPAVSINGQPRRLRFEDLHPEGVGGGSGGGGHDSWDGYGYGYGEGGQRWSQGVGEAL